MTPPTTTREHESETRMYGAQIPFDAINAPGTYIANWSGHLVRVPEDGFKTGRSPLIEFLGKEKLVVTKLSDDPYIALTKARMIAADLDLPVNF